MFKYENLICNPQCNLYVYSNIQKLKNVYLHKVLSSIKSEKFTILHMQRI